MAQNDNVLIWRLVEDQSRDCQQRIEPSTGLVYRFRNKICRELLLEQFLILKWIVVLGKWHRTRVEPAVDNLWNTMHFLTADRTLDRHFINIWAVQLDIIRAVVRHFLQFRNAADGMLMSTLTLPDIQRSSPVTVTADTPVLNIFQPVAETALTDTFRDPVDSIIIRDQIVLNIRHLNEPRFASVIDQRSITSPAVWITMLELRSIEQQSSCFQILQHFRISLLHK